MARIAINRGHLALADLRLDEALTLSERAERLVRDLGNQHGVGVALLNQAIALTLLGDVSRAADMARASIESFLAVGDALAIGAAAEVLAAAACEQGDAPLAGRLIGAVSRQYELAGLELDASDKQLGAAVQKRLEDITAEADLARWQLEGSRVGLAAVLAEAGVTAPADIVDSHFDTSHS